MAKNYRLVFVLLVIFSIALLSMYLVFLEKAQSSHYESLQDFSAQMKKRGDRYAEKLAQTLPPASAKMFSKVLRPVNEFIKSSLVSLEKMKYMNSDDRQVAYQIMLRDGNRLGIRLTPLILALLADADRIYNDHKEEIQLELIKISSLLSRELLAITQSFVEIIVEKAPS